MALARQGRVELVDAPGILDESLIADRGLLLVHVQLARGEGEELGDPIVGGLAVRAGGEHLGHLAGDAANLALGRFGDAQFIGQVELGDALLDGESLDAAEGEGLAIEVVALAVAGVGEVDAEVAELRVGAEGAAADEAVADERDDHDDQKEAEDGAVVLGGGVL